MGRTLPPLQKTTWLGRVTTDLLANPRNPASLRGSDSSKLDGGHFEINERSPLTSQLGMIRAEGVLIQWDSWRRMAGSPPPFVASGSSPPLDGQPGDLYQVAPVLRVPEVSFVK